MNYDQIVIGSGITGAATAYELTKAGFSVLLLEQDATPQNATRYSYGGLAYWSGTTDLTRQLCAGAIALYPTLSTELDADIEFRELDLLLTIGRDRDPQIVATSYKNFANPPQLLSIKAAGELEPLLNQDAMAGALTVKHGHIHPEKTAQAYIQAFTRAGGEMQITQVTGLLKAGTQVTGVNTTNGIYHSANVVVCAGGLSRQLLKLAGISIPLYFTHAEIVEIPPVPIKLRTLVMPADTTRFQLEADASQVDELWDQPGNELLPPILDVGAIQFRDGSLRLGQISRVLTDPHAKIDEGESEQWLRHSIGQILPALNQPGTQHHCLVGFSRDRLPLIGAIPGWTGMQIFSGFSNPLVIIPPLAKRFARVQTGHVDQILTQLGVNRFHEFADPQAQL
jgi:glycine/D-amino acid oxidase-like deaminating enzyme